jgi:hypothetical protein
MTPSTTTTESMTAPAFRVALGLVFGMALGVLLIAATTVV